MDSKAVKAFLRKQIAAVRSVGLNDESAFENAVSLLSGTRGKILVSGIGKSGHIGQKTAASMTSLGVPAVFVHPAEAFHGDLGMFGKDDSVVLLSHSGETRETVRLLQHLKRIGAKVVAVTGDPKSTLGREAAATLTYRVKEEGSPENVAPMASTTAMLVIGDLLACALCAKCGFTAKGFAASHPGGSLGLQLASVSEVMKGKERLPIVSETATFAAAVREINEHRVGATSVVGKGGRIVGVLTDGDVRRFLLAEGFDMRAPVSGLMARNPRVVGPDASLHEALRVMEEKPRIMTLFVVDKKKRPVGVLHMHHIIQERLI